MNVEEKLMRYAQSTGHLQGVLIGMALHDDDIHPIQFTMIYRALERSAELTGNAMGENDRERFHKRAEALGITL
jgi:hypothetical protein